MSNGFRLLKAGDKLLCGICFDSIFPQQARSHFDKCETVDIPRRKELIQEWGTEALQCALVQPTAGQEFGCFHCRHGPMSLAGICSHQKQCALAQEYEAQELRKEQSKIITKHTGKHEKKNRQVAKKQYESKPRIKAEQKKKAQDRSSRKKKAHVPKTPTIPANKKTNNSLCMLMTYAADPPEVAANPNDPLLSNQPPGVRAVIAAHDRGEAKSYASDLARLRSLEHHCKVEAYTISLVECDIDRHYSVDISTSRFNANKAPWNKDMSEENFKRFDQICFDWTNTPQGYFQDRVGKGALLDFLLEECPYRFLNKSGGAVYIPFSLPYYEAVVSKLGEIEKKYHIAYLTRNGLVKCHLYRGTDKMGDKVRELLSFNDSDLENNCQISLRHINGNSFEDGELLLRHFKQLSAMVDDVESIRMICLTLLPKKSPPAQA